MHGIIHLELKRFVEHHYGADAWTALVRRAGLDGEIYTPLRAYPDEQILKLVGIACEMTGRTPTGLLESFGEFVVATYIRVYGSLLKRDWRTLDVIENTENTIHRVVRARQPGASPPRLRVARTAPDEVRITYDSERKLCAVARGIVFGLAAHFNEAVTVTDQRCMLRGDDACLLVVTQRR